MKEHINNFIRTPFGSLLVTLMVLMSAYAFDYLESMINNPKNIIYGVLFSIFIIIISIVIYANFSKFEIKQEYETNNEILKAFIQGHGLGDLVNTNELAMIENNAEIIWVFTLDLSNDIGIEKINKQDNTIFKTVRENLKQGKEYIYFLPDEPSIRGSVNYYKEIHKIENDQVKFCFIPKKEFHIVSEIAIYNPKSNNPIAMQWFPSSKMNYYIKLDKNYTLNIIGSGDILLEKYLKC